MSARTVLRRAGRVEYLLLRTPLTVVDLQVVQRFLPEDSPVRRSFAGALGAFDQAALRLISDPAPAAKDRTSTSTPTRPRPSEEDEQIADLAEELLEEEETENLAGELAEDDELRRVQAELNAKRLIEEQQERRDSGS